MKHMAAILQALSLNNLSSANIGALLALPIAMGGLDDRCYVGCALRLLDQPQLYTLLEIRPGGGGGGGSGGGSSPKAASGKTPVFVMRQMPEAGAAGDAGELPGSQAETERVSVAQLAARVPVAPFPFERLSQVRPLRSVFCSAGM